MVEPNILLDLRANESKEVIIHKGEPLTLRVTIRNWGAFDSATHNRSIEAQKQNTEREFKAGTIDEKEYKDRVASLDKQKKETKSYKIGSNKIAWPFLIKFEIFEGNAWKPADWKLDLLSYSPRENMTSLDDIGAPTAEFGLGPSELKKIAAGEYKMRSQLSVAQISAVSDAVTVKVSDKVDENPTMEKMFYVGRQFVAMGAGAEVMQIAQKILKTNPHSIDGLILKAEAEESSGKLRDALKTLKEAEDEWHSQGLDQDEGPRYIRTKMFQIQTKIGEKAGSKKRTRS